MQRVACYTLIEITSGVPIGVHALPLTEEGLNDACELACQLWEENDLSPLLEAGVMDSIKTIGVFEKYNKYADYGIHLQKNEAVVDNPSTAPWPHPIEPAHSRQL